MFEEKLNKYHRIALFDVLTKLVFETKKLVYWLINDNSEIKDPDLIKENIKNGPNFLNINQEDLEIITIHKIQEITKVDSIENSKNIKSALIDLLDCKWRGKLTSSDEICDHYVLCLTPLEKHAEIQFKDTVEEKLLFNVSKFILHEYFFSIFTDDFEKYKKRVHSRINSSIISKTYIEGDSLLSYFVKEEEKHFQ